MADQAEDLAGFDPQVDRLERRDLATARAVRLMDSMEFDQWKNLVGIVRQQEGDPGAQFNVRAYICLALVIGC